MAEAAALFFPQHSINEASNDETDDITSVDDSDSCITTSTSTHQQIVKQTRGKVVFNDGTAAGVLNNLKSCTRTMHLHEADVSLKSWGLLLPSPNDITPTRVDPFRSTLMSLHEKPGNFLRILKKEKIHITGSKLNIFVYSFLIF